MKYYSGIGSRETPGDIQDLMIEIGYFLSGDDWILRSGGADGADVSFEIGAKAGYGVGITENYPKIFLPWSRYNGNNSNFTEPQLEAFDVAQKFHPAWHRLSQGAKKLHARNSHIVLGSDVTRPVLSSFIVCWTKDAKGGGGTGQALRIAKHFNIFIYDLGDEDTLEDWNYFVQKKKRAVKLSSRGV